jgi:ketosteroid isomerase-like protein
MGAVMKMIGAAAVAMALWIATASAEELTAARSRAIVERQFEAFVRDDAEAAYALADPTIKQKFVDADGFMAMVRESYAPVYRHRSVEFGDFAELGDEASLKATLVDNDDVEWTALYSFRREENGDWLISGCVLVRSDASAI